MKILGKIYIELCKKFDLSAGVTAHIDWLRFNVGALTAWGPREQADVAAG